LARAACAHQRLGGLDLCLGNSDGEGRGAAAAAPNRLVADRALLAEQPVPDVAGALLRSLVRGCARLLPYRGRGYSGRLQRAGRVQRGGLAIELGDNYLIPTASVVDSDVI
jgi:hypothetical protein